MAALEARVTKAINSTILTNRFLSTDLPIYLRLHMACLSSCASLPPEVTAVQILLQCCFKRKWYITPYSPFASYLMTAG